MAEFTIVTKEYKRMCDSYKDCSKCSIRQVIDSAYTCRYWTLIENPEKAEEVIMQWAEKHPPVTNREKFVEVFGCDPIFLDFWSQRGGEWLREEYKEPKNE